MLWLCSETLLRSLTVMIHRWTSVSIKDVLSATEQCHLHPFAFKLIRSRVRSVVILPSSSRRTWGASFRLFCVVTARESPLGFASAVGFDPGETLAERVVQQALVGFGVGDESSSWCAGGSRLAGGVALMSS